MWEWGIRLQVSSSSMTQSFTPNVNTDYTLLCLKRVDCDVQSRTDIWLSDWQKWGLAK